MRPVELAAQRETVPVTLTETPHVAVPLRVRTCRRLEPPDANEQGRARGVAVHERLPEIMS